MAAYECFADYYDALTTDVDYTGRCEHLLDLFRRYDRTPTLLLDVGCGTGGFTLAFAERGIEVIGVDPSPEMLAVAQQKKAERGLNALFLCQSGEDMDLYGTVDGAVCCLDTVNHVLTVSSLRRFFKRVSLFLEPGRLFLFDVNTLYKQKTVLGDHTFVYDREDFTCIWQNTFDARCAMTEIQLDFFCRTKEGYVRKSECFCERVYSHKLLRKLLCQAGFRLEAMLGENNMSRPGRYSQRNIYVARKMG